MMFEYLCIGIMDTIFMSGHGTLSTSQPEMFSVERITEL